MGRRRPAQKISKTKIPIFSDKTSPRLRVLASTFIRACLLLLLPYSSSSRPAAVERMSAIYRGCSLGDALVDALDVLVTEGKIDGPLAGRVMQSYDEVMAVRLVVRVGALLGKSTSSLAIARFRRKRWRKR